ncbi:MAG TPA: hypothetical protein VJN44_12175, partial [Roseateles sp.]|nr:hypothetical protein [Roseateles sp.]
LSQGGPRDEQAQGQGRERPDDLVALEHAFLVATRGSLCEQDPQIANKRLFEERQFSYLLIRNLLSRISAVGLSATQAGPTFDPAAPGAAALPSLRELPSRGARSA